MPAPSEDLLAAALEYALAGLPVLPLAGKVPRNRDGLTGASVDPAVLTDWWRRWPDANIGIRTGADSGLVVLDVDVQHGGAGTLAELEQQHGKLPRTAQTLTGGGGYHYLFAHSGREVRNSAGTLGAGLDTRGDGGYIVAPPSLHESGRPYKWVRTLKQTPPAEPPGWLLEGVEKRRNGPAAPVSDSIPKGQRDSTLASLAGTMRRRGMGEPEILAALRVANETRCDPPLPDRDVERIARSIARYAPQPRDDANMRADAEIASAFVQARTKADVPPAEAFSLDVVKTGRDGRMSAFEMTGELERTQLFPLTDLGNAERLVALHGCDLRFAPGLGWLAWDGWRWKLDRDGEPIRRAKATVRTMYAQAAELDDPKARGKLISHATASESEARLRAAVKLAETERPVIVAADELDADPWLFNAANGTIDLRTGELREHRRDELLSRMTTVVYDPDASSQLWDGFLERITGGDAELSSFLARAVGYTLTGHTYEEVLFFAHGPTATGKSSKLEAVKAALGEYGTVADFETFLKRRGDAGIRNDIARLAGARFVLSVEVDDGKALAEGLLKILTGGDTVAARFLYRETFEFQPRCKLWLAANERPRVNAGDDAIWRRILQIPFVCVIPEGERDERVKIRLRSDPDVHSAILAWAVRGCLEWQQAGLAAPQCVLDYTADYRAENDPLRDWLADQYEPDPDAWTSTIELRQSYGTWCDQNGEKPVTAKRLGALLEAAGYRTRRDQAAYADERDSVPADRTPLAELIPTLGQAGHALEREKLGASTHATTPLGASGTRFPQPRYDAYTREVSRKSRPTRPRAQKRPPSLGRLHENAHARAREVAA